MLAPSNRTITIPVGGTANVGRVAPPVPTPAWAVGAPLNAWIEILGTLGTNSGAPLDEYSGFALVGTRLIAAASGGHNLPDNRVVGIELNVDAPAWPTSPLCPSSAVFPAQSANLPYYADGKPNSRHSRYNIHYMPGVNGGRVMLLGARDVFGIGPPSFGTVDGFNLATSTWDGASAYPDITGGSASVDGGACVDGNGDGWVYSCTYKFTAATKTWSFPLTATAAKRVRYPWALATGKGYMFGLCYGDGWGYSLTLGVCAIKQVGNVQTQISFNPSVALDQFIADIPIEAGMDYDQINDCFLFCAGNPAGRVYKIVPNATTVWDMTIFQYGTGNTVPAAAPAGVQSRIKYVALLKGFVMLPRNTSNLLFMRTA